MNPAPSSVSEYTSLTIGQLIGLNLARLYAWCMRLQASGETRAPRDLARMVISTDAIVHSYVRMLASNQLERAGFTFAANAMRTPIWQRAEVGDIPVCSRAPSAPIERAQGCHVGSHETEGHTATVQGCDLNSMAELLDRLQTAIENFERAETLASHLARVIVCALAYIAPEVRTRCTYAIAVNEAAHSNSNPVAITKEPWPPPFRKPERQYAFKNP
jgi:hypothetical protein